MGTPFITLLEPTQLAAYDRNKPPQSQAASIPKTFVDAMTVREQVFVQEQSVPLEYDFDDDDARACHWVVYASVNRVVEQEERDPATGEVTRPRRSETSTVPVGTVRLVPFPHPPHPVRGGEYVNNELVNGGSGKDGEAEAERRSSSSTPNRVFPVDRATEYHDGFEPYVKLGRLAVVKEFRGHKLATLLARTALDWACEHPEYFNPSVANVGLEQLGLEKSSSVPNWDGLVCCHAQDTVVGAWEKVGFKVDKEMGTWLEEGIPHVGMFQRVQIKAVSGSN